MLSSILALGRLMPVGQPLCMREGGATDGIPQWPLAEVMQSSLLFQEILIANFTPEQIYFYRHPSGDGTGTWPEAGAPGEYSVSVAFHIGCIFSLSKVTPAPTRVKILPKGAPRGGHLERYDSHR